MRKRSQFVRFGVVGLLNTAVDLGVLNILLYATGVTSGWGFATIKSVSFLSATVNGYLLNRKWVFKVLHGPDTKEFLYFLISSSAGLLLNVSVASVLVSQVHFSFLPRLVWVNMAVLIAASIAFLWNFFSQRYILMKDKSVCL